MRAPGGPAEDWWGERMRPLIRRPSRLAAIAAAAAILVPLGAPAGALGVVLDPDTLVAELAGSNVPTDGDPGGSGTVSIHLDAAQGQACYTLDVTLTDLAGDPPTAFDVRDMEGNVVIGLGTSVDGAGHAEGCADTTGTVIDALFATPGDYLVDVRTAGYPDGAVAGNLTYSYPVGGLGIRTRVCPPSIQSVAALTESAKATCVDKVLPANAPDIPTGYTLVGFGGTATFDYHVSDGRHLDATLLPGNFEGGYSCNSQTKECTGGGSYLWQVGIGAMEVTPTVLPAGTRFGLATATSISDDTVVIPVTVGLANLLTMDATGTDGVSLNVFLFQSADTTKPTVSAPKAAFRGSGTFGRTAPVRLTWTASDAGSGLDHYTVQRSIDGAAFANLATNVRTRSFDTAIAAGHTYRFRVRAYDAAGNSRLSSASAAQHLRVVQDGSSSVHYTGTWLRRTPAGASGGTVRSSTVKGSVARFTFTGRSVAWVAPVGTTRGSAVVTIDGGSPQTINLYAPAAPRQVVFARRFGSVGTHTIRIRVLGTAGHARVDVDAFLVLN